MKPTDEEFIQLIRKLRTNDFNPLKGEKYAEGVYETIKTLLMWFPSGDIIDNIGKMEDEQVLTRAKKNLIVL